MPTPRAPRGRACAAVRMDARLCAVARACAVAVMLAVLLAPAALSAQEVTHDAPAAQEPTATLAPTSTLEPTATLTSVPATAALPLRVTLLEPAIGVAGRVSTLSLLGQGFTPATTVRLNGYGLLTVSVLNGGALTAQVPADVPPGVYTVEVADPLSLAVTAPVAVTLLAPTATPAPTLPATETPLPTSTPFPTSTPAPGTPIPGQPTLIVRAFAAAPSAIAQGETTRLQLEVFNIGSRTAEGVILAVGEGAFTAAAGQASVTLPAVAPNTSIPASIVLTARRDAPLGSVSVPLTLRYRDFEGTAYTASASASITITAAAAQSARPVIDGYRVQTVPAVIGETTEVTINLKNIGTVTAEAVVLRFTGDALLLPATAGDTFAFGDLAPEAFSLRTLAVRVASTASPGLRTQAITLQYIENGTPREVQTSIGVEVAARTVERPVILLEQYETDAAMLSPGTQFTLTYTLRNIGAADADTTLATFGVLETSSSGPVAPSAPSGGGSGADAGASGATTNTTTSTTPSTLFAPIGSGTTVFIGALPAGETATFTQRLLVNTGVSGGVQVLPITLTYRLSDGSSAQTVLPVSLVVRVPPRLQANLDAPLPPTVNTGEPLTVTLQILNTGRNPQPVQQIELIADNADVLDGAVQFVGVLAANDDTAASGTILPVSEGLVVFTFRVLYLDELNQTQAIAFPFTVEAVAPPPLIIEPFPIEPVATPPPTTPPDDFIGRLLLGFLNLGG